MAHSDAREGKWRGNWRMEWVASTLHTTSEHGVSSITTADAHTSATSSRLNWRPRRFKCTRPFRRKTKSGFCACAITFQTQSTNLEINAFFCYTITVIYTEWHKSHVTQNSREFEFMKKMRTFIEYFKYPKFHSSTLTLPPKSILNLWQPRWRRRFLMCGLSVRDRVSSDFCATL